MLGDESMISTESFKTEVWHLDRGGTGVGMNLV